MKAQIMLRYGPYDMNLVSYATAPMAKEFPVELRVGSHNELMESGKFAAAVYRRVEVEEAPASLMWFGLYEFTGMRETAETLVDVWIT